MIKPTSKLNPDKDPQQAEKWLNQHLIPSSDYLLNLAKNGSAEARSELMDLADQYDLNYTNSTNMVELAQQIILAMDSDSDNQTQEQ